MVNPTFDDTHQPLTTNPAYYENATMFSNHHANANNMNHSLSLSSALSPDYCQANPMYAASGQNAASIYAVPFEAEHINDGSDSDGDGSAYVAVGQTQQAALRPPAGFYEYASAISSEARPYAQPTATSHAYEAPTRITTRPATLTYPLMPLCLAGQSAFTMLKKLRRIIETDPMATAMHTSETDVDLYTEASSTTITTQAIDLLPDDVRLYAHQDQARIRDDLLFLTGLLETWHNRSNSNINPGDKQPFTFINDEGFGSLAQAIEPILDHMVQGTDTAYAIPIGQQSNLPKNSIAALIALTNDPVNAAYKAGLVAGHLLAEKTCYHKKIPNKKIISKRPIELSTNSSTNPLLRHAITDRALKNILTTLNESMQDPINDGILRGLTAILVNSEQLAQTWQKPTDIHIYGHHDTLIVDAPCPTPGMYYHITADSVVLNQGTQKHNSIDYNGTKYTHLATHHCQYLVDDQHGDQPEIIVYERIDDAFECRLLALDINRNGDCESTIMPANLTSIRNMLAEKSQEDSNPNAVIQCICKHPVLFTITTVVIAVVIYLIAASQLAKWPFTPAEPNIANDDPDQSSSTDGNQALSALAALGTTTITTTTAFLNAASQALAAASQNAADSALLTTTHPIWTTPTINKGNLATTIKPDESALTTGHKGNPATTNKPDESALTTGHEGNTATTKQPDESALTTGHKGNPATTKKPDESALTTGHEGNPPTTKMTIKTTKQPDEPELTTDHQSTKEQEADPTTQAKETTEENQVQKTPANTSPPTSTPTSTATSTGSQTPTFTPTSTGTTTGSQTPTTTQTSTPTPEKQAPCNDYTCCSTKWGLGNADDCEKIPPGNPCIDVLGC